MARNKLFGQGPHVCDYNVRVHVHPCLFGLTIYHILSTFKHFMMVERLARESLAYKRLGVNKTEIEVCVATSLCFCKLTELYK